MTAKYLLVTDPSKGEATITGYANWDEVEAAALEMTKRAGCVGYEDAMGAYATIGHGVTQIGSILRSDALSAEEAALVGGVDAGASKTVKL